MPGRPLRINPLRALIWLEVSAMGFSFAFDILRARMHITPNPVDPRSFATYSAAFFASAFALLAIPHAPNHRYALVAFAIAAIVVANISPTGALSPLILFIVLAARLTFAFGLVGSLVAWLVAFLTIFGEYAQLFFAKPTMSNAVSYATTLVQLTVMLTLLFGLFGIMWLYARRGAVAAATAERTRIALDLHDSIGHSLTTLSVHLQNAVSLADIDRFRSRQYVERAKSLADEALEDVRETVTMFHDEPSPDTHSIALMLDRLRADFAAARPFTIDWNVRFEKEPQGRSALALYRVLQEALTNVARHACAHAVSVDIHGGPTSVELSVADDGCGFDGEDQDGHGLLSMRTRVESLSGTFTINSAAGRGTRLHARFPLEIES